MSDALTEALLSSRYQARENPFGIAAQSLALNAGRIVNPYGSTGSNAAASIGAALLAGLMGGVARYQTDNDNAELAPVAQRLLATSDPAAQAQMVQEHPRLAGLVAALSAEQNRRAAELAQKQQELEIGRQSKMLEIPIDVAKENALLGNFEAKQKIKGKYDPSAPNIDLGMGKGLPAASVGKIAESKAMIDEARLLATEIEKTYTGGVKGWAKLQGAKTFSGLDENELMSNVRNLADRGLRSRTGAAAPNDEKKEVTSFIAGDITADPVKVARFLRRFAASEARAVQSELSLAEQMAKGDVSQFKSELSEAAKYSPSEIGAPTSPPPGGSPAPKYEQRALESQGYVYDPKLNAMVKVK